MFTFSPIKRFAVRMIALLEVSEMLHELLPEREGAATQMAARADLDRALTADHSLLPTIVLLLLAVMIFRDFPGKDTLLSLLGLGVAFFNAWLTAGSDGLAEILFFMVMIIGLVFVVRRLMGVFPFLWRSVR